MVSEYKKKLEGTILNFRYIYGWEYKWNKEQHRNYFTNYQKEVMEMYVEK